MLKRISLPAFFLVGAATGATLGLLYAPHNGRVTRAKLKAKIEEERDQLEERALMLEQKAKAIRRQAADKIGQIKKSTAEGEA